MTGASVEDGLAVACLLFVVGLAGLLSRRNLAFMLMAVEIMLNAAGLAFVMAGARWGKPDGQVMFLFVLALAAAEVAVGLALILQIDRRLGTVDGDALDRLRG